MKFVYRKQDGSLQHYALADGWTEVGRYIEGVLVDGGFKTFRKDRVSEYLDGAEGQLSDPFSPPPPRLTKAPRSVDDRPQVLFTGFPSVQRKALEDRAGGAGLNVVKSVTLGLTFLCGGPNAGPAKLASARGQHVFILTQAQFLRLIDTGELPDEDDIAF